MNMFVDFCDVCSIYDYMSICASISNRSERYCRVSCERFHKVVEAGWPHTSVVSMKDAEEAEWGSGYERIPSKKTKWTNHDKSPDNLWMHYLRGFRFLSLLKS